MFHEQFHFWVWTQKNGKLGLKQITGTPMFVAALFTITKEWKEHKCLLTDESIDKNVVNTYNGILFSLKKEGSSDTHT